MKKDFKQFFIQSTGQSLVQQGEFQEISAVDSDGSKKEDDSSDDDFKEEDDEQPQRGIKTAQFWNGLKMMTNAPPPNKDPVKWKVSCPMSFGFNSLGRDNIFYLDGSICKAAGCLLIYQERIYPKHSKKITALSYNVNTQQLLSATQSSAPELFMWKYNKQKRQLQWIKRFFIGKNCQDLYAISFFKNDYVGAVEKFTLHKSSCLHFFNKGSGKKVASLKVGKFYDLELLQVVGNQEQSQDEQQESEEILQQERLFFANDEGISELIFSDTQSSEPLKIQSLLKMDNITCLSPFYSSENQQTLQILYGDKEGNINLLSKKQSTKVHQGWIFEIKHHIHQGTDYFFSLGALDSNLSIIQYKDNKFNILHNIHLGGYGRSIERQNDLLLIGKRDGSYEQFGIVELIEQQDASKIQRKQSTSLSCFQSKGKGKQFLINCEGNEQQNHAYGHTGSKNITFFTLHNRQLTNLTSYTLRSYPSTTDLSGDIIAYTYDVSCKDDDKIDNFASIDSKLYGGKKEKQFEKSVLVIQDYTKKLLLQKIAIKLQGQSTQYEQKCTTIKFSPTKKYLALGNNEGTVYIYQVGQGQNNIKFTKCSTRMHKQPITQLIWSNQQKNLKTISSSQLFYWQVVESKQQKKQSLLSLNNVKALQVKDVKWSALGKFSWEVKNVWDSTSQIEEIYKFWQLERTMTKIKENKLAKQVESLRQLMIGCTTMDGCLRLYNYPANASKKQEIKLNCPQFQVCQYTNENNKFQVLVAIEGILIMLEFS